MKLKNILARSKKAILEKWNEAIVNSYPEESRQFIRKSSKQFTNPLGYNLAKHSEAIFDALVADFDVVKIGVSLEELTKIAAVGDSTPSESLRFLYELKVAVREIFLENMEEVGDYEELFEFEDEIDRMFGMAFDFYVASREKLFRIRANEVRASAFTLIEKINKRYYPRRKNDEKQEDK